MICDLHDQVTSGVNITATRAKIKWDKPCLHTASRALRPARPKKVVFNKDCRCQACHAAHTHPPYASGSCDSRMDVATETDTYVDCDMVEELFRALYAHDADHMDPDMDSAPPTCHEQFDALLSRVQVSVEPGDDIGCGASRV